MEFATILGAAKKKPAAVATDKTANKRLQAALATLGKIAKSPSLSAIKADGALGAKTVAAVNLAYTKHLGPGQAPAELRTGKLTLSFINTNTNQLASYIETEIRRRGTTPASPATVAKASAVQAVQNAPTMTPANAKASAKRLQAAIVALGKATGSAKLKIAVDGAPGKATVAAVNWAFTNHIGAGQAPAAMRTGQLTLEYIKGNADTLATFVEAETKRRATAAKTDTKTIAVTKTSAKDLQEALVNLGKVAGSAALKAIKMDGALGAKTVAAVNLAFTQHIGSGQAPAMFRTGRLSLADIKANIGELIRLIFVETRRRGGAARVPVAQPIPVKTKSGKVVQAQRIDTAKGTTYKVKDEETGATYFTADPTAAEPPAPPAGMPEPTPAQEEVAAEASAAAASAGRPAVVSPSQIAPRAAAKAVEDRDAGQEPDAPGAGALTPANADVLPPGPESSSGGETFFSKYKFAIIGGGLLAAGGIGYMVLKKRGGATSPSRSSFQPQRRMVRA